LLNVSGLIFRTRATSAGASPSFNRSCACSITSGVNTTAERVRFF
jgi:hypothetical protein